MSTAVPSIVREPSPEELRASLENFRLTEWHPLYILLLAQG